MQRILSPTEKTHLARYKPEALGTIDQYGEMPVEYISGVAEFCGMLFTVTPDVLIPRLETEELTELAYQEAVQLLNNSTVKQLNICEVGTGCGAVAITLAKKLQTTNFKFQIVASDVTDAVIKVAQANAEKLLTDEVRSTKYEVQFQVSDLLSQYPGEQVFDLIIANLPYIPSDRISHLDASVKDYEPHLALDGGGEGLTLIKKMITQAAGHSHQGSVMLLEVDYTHTANEFDEFLDAWQIETVIDQFYRQRFVKLSRIQ